MSLDEAFLDVSDAGHFSGSATRIAQDIRRRVSNQLHITVSAGVAPNKFLAKIASDWKKPNGLFVITPDQVEDFVASLPSRPSLSAVTFPTPWSLAASVSVSGVWRTE